MNPLHFCPPRPSNSLPASSPAAGRLERKQKIGEHNERDERNERDGVSSLAKNLCNPIIRVICDSDDECDKRDA